MCSICGEVNFDLPTINKDEILNMSKKMKHRGPDESDIICCKGATLAHNRLSVMDLENGHQPMSVFYGNKKYTIVYNGEIYNLGELRDEIKRRGIFLKTRCDTELVLYSYILYGDECPKYLNGIFAFAVYDGERLFLARDRFGVKPLYFSVRDNSFIFASEIKAMLSHSKISSDVSREGLWEILYLSPNFVNGKSPFKDILELLPGECMIFSKNGLRRWKYWQVVAKPFFKDKKYATEKTRELVSSAIKSQLVSDAPLSVLLSGGLDSSVVSAVASEHYKERGEILSTYSFEYEGNRESFRSSEFQPQSDDEYAIYLANYLGTNHTVLRCPTNELISDLEIATTLRDMPGQADIDSSLYYFCKEIKKNHTVTLSGECSDEIFGGYPWFYKEKMLYSDFFPWIHSPRLRPSLFKDSVSNSDEGFDYVREIYRKTLLECPTLKSDTPEMKTSRIASHLSVSYFMTSLLQRKDRMSMGSGLEVRVPFSDYRIYEFVFNVPWEIKFENQVEKALLRNAMCNYLPEKILNRKKSPYPKTHNKEYFEGVMRLFNQRYERSHYLKECLDLERLYEVISKGGTWFGQLMDTPQLIAWLIQLDFWIEKYKVNIV